LNAVPAAHDESAYLLQARIFAAGHWTAPGRPLPEFFEQTHVFVTPFLAAKYPPGHSLALVPGIWLGLPGLVPVLASGVAGSFLYLLARRLAGPRVALLAWLVWLTAPADLSFRASYLSESTSTALWLAGWWALLRWRETGRPRFLLALAALSGWLFLTRPLTMLAFSIPVGWVVLRDVIARRAWRPFFASIAIGGLLLAVVPLWSWKTLGDWRTTPYRQYSRVYYPYQWSGFRFDETPAQRPHPPEMDGFDRMFRRIQREHRLADLPEIFGRRLEAIGEDVWGSGRRYLFVFAILGVLEAGRETVFGLGSGLVLVLAYLIYPHSPAWSIYYMEAHGALAFVTALGLWRVLAGLAARLGPKPALSQAFLRWGFRAVSVGAVLLPALPQLALVRWSVHEKSAEQTRFRDALAGLRGRKAVVFVRYSDQHDPHRELISNEPDLSSARVWIVYDRGPRNEDLLRLAPERSAWLYDEAHHRLGPLNRRAGGA
jgi:hypothetical protein